MTPRHAPRVAEWLLRQALPPGDAGQTILGDLLEEFDRSGGSPAARRRFTRQAFSIAVRYGLRREEPAITSASEGEPMGFEGLGKDLRFALRGLLKRPSFAVVVLATLALGIGASTAIFSLVDAILLRPLPFAEPDRLVYVTETNDGNRMPFAYPNYVDFRDRAQSYASFACHQGNSFTVVGTARPQRVDGRLVCWNFFDVLGVRPQLGRPFTEADDRVDAEPVAIVSDRFWKRDLGGDPNVVGRTVKMAERTFTIVGVLPADFRFSRPEEIYTPLGPTVTADSGWLDRGNHFGLAAVARLKPGVPLEQAGAEADLIAADLSRAYPNTNSGSGARVVSLHSRIVEQVRDTLVALMWAVGFLLVLACVNVANLLVARGAARQHELAIRTALGGSRWRLVRHLLAESTLLSVAGAALGVLLAHSLLRAFVAIAPPDVPRIDGVSLNRASLLFALGAAALCGLVFGAFPAIRASGSQGLPQLARATRTSASVSPHRTRRVLMVVEVALALVLLAGCGLMARTMMHLNAVDPGFRTDHLLTGRIALMGEPWTLERRRAFHDQLLAKLRAIPAVSHAALTLSLPIEGSQWGSIFIVNDKPVPPRAELPSSAFIPVSAGYFETMGIRVIKGRTFDDRESPTGAPTLVINETLAKTLWPGEDPIGKRLKQGWPELPGTWREVVGVVADVKLEGVDQDTPMQAFLPMRQETARSAAIVARTTIDPMGVAAAVEAAVQSLDKDLPVASVKPMTELMRSAIARQRLSTAILSVFAIVAILIAAVGLYGIVSHSVTERTREIGVRMALGAEGRQVLGLFVGQGLVTAAIGTVIGLGGAALLSRTLESLLFNVKPSDPLTLAAVSCLLLVVAMIACYLPARRAARIDPLLALRAE